MQGARLQNPYMRAHKEAGSRGRRRDKRQRECTDKNTESPACTSHHWSMLKVSDICLLVLLFFFLPWCSNCSMGENRKSSLKHRGWICAFFISPTIPPDRQEHSFFSRLPFFLFLKKTKKTFSPLVRVNCCPPFCIQRAKCMCRRWRSRRSDISSDPGCVSFCLHAFWWVFFLKSNAFFCFEASSILFSHPPPDQTCKRNTMKRAIASTPTRASERNFYALSTFSCPISRNLDELLQANAGWGASEIIKSCRRHS